MRAWTRGCWPILLAAAISPACNRRGPAGPTYTYTNPTIGLTLTVPRAIEIGTRRFPVRVDQTPTGFDVRCCETGRYHGRVTVQFNPGVTAPLGTWRKTRTIGDVDVHYAILDLEEGGSGGEAYRFTAWRKARDGHLLYIQEDQGDGLEPDFDLAWFVIEGTKLSP